MSEDLIPATWKDDHQYRATRFTFYSSNFRSHEPSLVDAALRTCITLSGYPLQIVGATLDNGDVRKRIRLGVRYHGGEHQLTMATENVKIPTGDQLMLMSPLRKDSTGTVDVDLERTIAAARGMLGIVFGNGFLHTHFGNSIFDHASRQWSDDWSNTEFVSDISHQFFKPIDYDTLAKLRAKLRLSNANELKGRIEFCLAVVGRSFDRDDKRLEILDYWTALEILFKGKRRLTAYIDRCRRDTYERQALLRLKLKRGALVHSGFQEFISDEDVEFLRAVIMTKICLELEVSDKALFEKLERPLSLPLKMVDEVLLLSKA